MSEINSMFATLAHFTDNCLCWVKTNGNLKKVRFEKKCKLIISYLPTKAINRDSLCMQKTQDTSLFVIDA